ncbi:hypothetical protein BDZ91DRAFT_760891 [Kalaharituber pfeilii]|nr:hypothetical protein BDZ91DRAFT_760891 [Kalaharituber pfeilii]
MDGPSVCRAHYFREAYWAFVERANWGPVQVLTVHPISFLGTSRHLMLLLFLRQGIFFHGLPPGMVSAWRRDAPVGSPRHGFILGKRETLGAVERRHVDGDRLDAWALLCVSATGKAHVDHLAETEHEGWQVQSSICYRWVRKCQGSVYGSLQPLGGQGSAKVHVGRRAARQGRAMSGAGVVHDGHGEAQRRALTLHSP